MNYDEFVPYILCLLGGVSAGAASCWIAQRAKLGPFHKISQDILKKAEQECELLKKSAEYTLKQNQIDQQRSLDQLWQGERKKMHLEEERIKQKEDKLESRLNLVEKKLSDIEKRNPALLESRVVREAINHFSSTDLNCRGTLCTNHSYSCLTIWSP